MAPKQDKNAVSFEEIIQKGALRCDAMRHHTMRFLSYSVLLDGHVFFLFFSFQNADILTRCALIARERRKHQQFTTEFFQRTRQKKNQSGSGVGSGTATPKSRSLENRISSASGNKQNKIHKVLSSHHEAFQRRRKSCWQNENANLDWLLSFGMRIEPKCPSYRQRQRHIHIRPQRPSSKGSKAWQYATGHAESTACANHSGRQHYWRVYHRPASAPTPNTSVTTTGQFQHKRHRVGPMYGLRKQLCAGHNGSRYSICF